MAARTRSLSPGLALAALYALATAVYLVLAHSSALPALYPDEVRYAHLARSLVDGQGFNWRGDHVGQTSALYILFIAPAWAIFNSSIDAYSATKTLGTLVLCAQIIPVWFLARDLVGPRIALIPAALSVAGTWMLFSAETTTEALAFPLATAGLCVAVMALRRPGSRLGWLALMFLFLASWARLQVAVLIPALLAAYLLDAARRPGFRDRLRAHRPYVVGLGALSLAGLLIVLAAPSAAGDYAGFFDFHPGLGRLVSRIGIQALELVALSGFAPVLFAAGAACTAAAWRDDRLGPLLAVFWPAAIATILQSGFYVAGYPTVPTGIERYVTFAVPLTFVIMVVILLEPRLVRRRAVLIAGALGLAFLAMPTSASINIERAVWSTSHRVHQLLGVGPVVAMSLAAIGLVAAIALVRVRARTPFAAMTIAAAVLFGVLVVQSQASWHYLIRLTTSERAQYPSDLRWLDHNSRGPVAHFGVVAHSALFQNVDYFNRNIARSYQPANELPGLRPEGGSCTWTPGSDGTIQIPASCGAVMHRFWVDDPWARVKFHDEISSVSDDHLGRIVELAATAKPRLESILSLPCPPHPTPNYSDTSPDIPSAGAPVKCLPAFSGVFWLDEPNEIVLRFRGGAADHSLAAGGRSWAIPKGTVSTVRFHAPAGFSQFSLVTDWKTNAGAPVVVSAALENATETTPLL
jgi:hypothetical protein